ncbi:nucleotide exchange factor GrpE [Pseudokineococcus sp. 1T1Z-3]|uniref:nucleotide exchange factor GrpE n=1 Tax=Pseudokineococcus sp. 1T1Z-3 TaxID=3132745 RepID=UPI0030988C7C
MTAGAPGPDPREGEPVIRDRRRFDPVTGRLREQPAGPEDETPQGATPEETPQGEQPDVDPEAVPTTEPAGDPADTTASDLTAEDVIGSGTGADEALQSAQQLAEERLGDLQRLQAEYVNYRRRVDRDRDVATTAGKTSVFEALLPVLDDVVLARTHGGLVDGPAAAIADKLEQTLQRLGLERYGDAGEAFDPAVHEALMHGHADGIEVTTVTQVLQPGYKVGERVVRAARVAVADPQ